MTQLSKRKRIIVASRRPLKLWAFRALGEVGPHQGETMQVNRGLFHAIGLAVAALVTAGSAAHAQLMEADIGVNPTFEQTDATTVNSTGGFFSARAFVTNESDFDGGTLTYAGPG